MDEKKYLELVNTLVVSLDPKGKITYVNKKTEEVLGYKRKYLLGKNWFDMCIPKKDRKNVKDVFKKIISGKIKFVDRFQNNILTKNGKERTIDWFNSLIKEDNKIEIIGSGNDVTEKKEIEDEYNRLVNELELAQEISNIGRWKFDLVNDKLTWTNKVYEIFEVDKDFKVSYKNLFKLIHPKDREIVEKTFGESIKNKTHYNAIHRIITPSKKTKWVQELCITEYKNNKPIVSRGTVQDITNIKKNEELLKNQNNELEMFRKMSVNRELKMIQLKKKIEKLKKKNI